MVSVYCAWSLHTSYYTTTKRRMVSHYFRENYFQNCPYRPFRFCKLTRVCNKNHHCTESSENTSGNLVSNTVRACLIRVVIPWQCVIVSIYWAFSATPHSFLSQEELCWLPRVCYLTTFLSIIALCYKPLSVYVQPTQSEAPLVYGISTAYTSPFLTLQVTPFILFWNF